MWGPPLSPSEIVAILRRRYDAYRSLGRPHDSAVVLVAADYRTEAWKVETLLFPAASEARKAA